MVDYTALKVPHPLPQAAAVDVSQIKGNVTDEQKQLAGNLFSYFVSTREKSYGADIGQRLKIVEMNIWGKGEAAYGETIFEIDIQKDMCNVFGTLHGACAAYMVDPYVSFVMLSSMSCTHLFSGVRPRLSFCLVLPLALTGLGSHSL